MVMLQILLMELPFNFKNLSRNDVLFFYNIRLLVISMKNLIKEKLKYFVYFDHDWYLNFIYEIILNFCHHKKKSIACKTKKLNFYPGLYNFFINWKSNHETIDVWWQINKIMKPKLHCNYINSATFENLIITKQQFVMIYII